MSEFNKATPETPISIVVPVPEVPQKELDRLGFAGKTGSEIANELAKDSSRIELTILRKHLPDQVDPKDLIGLMKDSPDAFYVQVRRPAPAPENLVRPGTLVKAFTGLVKATGNFNHFLATPQGTQAMVKHMNDTRKWWPEYTTYFTDARIRIMLAAYVVIKHHPDIVQVFPDVLNKSKVAGAVLASCIARMGEGVSDEDAIPPNIKDVWNTQAYWEEAVKFADRMGSKRNEAYNLDVERKKNPGHFKVGSEWYPYGSVFTDDKGQELVVINHSIVPKALVESRGQGFENSLAVMPLEKAQPAIDRINELGGNMFAAICRVGFAEIEQLVAECGELDVKQLGMRRDALALPLSTGHFAPLSQTVSIDDLTDEQIEGIKPGWSAFEGKTRRESWAHYGDRGAKLQWVINAYDQETKDKILAGNVAVETLPGAQLVLVMPADFYDGCTKIDHEAEKLCEELDKNAVVVTKE